MSGLAMTPASSTSTGPQSVQLKLADALKQAQALYTKGDIDNAERFAAAIAAKRPNHPLAMQILAGVAEKRGQGARAIEILQHSLNGGSSDALALMNLCRLLRMRGQLEEAREAGERAVAIGTLPDALVDLGDAYAALGEHARARDLFERAVARRPNLARAHLGLAQALLREGDFRPGWIEYEWRYRMPSTQSLLPKFKQPQWNGMELKSSRLLIIAEQGYGDCIQFARYLPMVAQRVKDVIVGVGNELRSVIETVDGLRTCYERWEHLPPFDFQITMSSLPQIFGTTVETIPAQVPYISADRDKTEHWRARLMGQAQGRKSVGFVWQGRPQHPNDRARSMALGHLTRFLELDNVMPVSLQFGAGREQVAEHRARARVLDAGGEFKDFSDTAACVAAVDCVISIDSAVAHLAGALAKPGFVMLPKVAEWRWFDERSDSPWYPTLELVRQDASGTWDGVVGHIVDRLRA